MNRQITNIRSSANMDVAAAANAISHAATSAKHVSLRVYTAAVEHADRIIIIIAIGVDKYAALCFEVAGAAQHEAVAIVQRGYEIVASAGEHVALTFVVACVAAYVVVEDTVVYIARGVASLMMEVVAPALVGCFYGLAKLGMDMAVDGVRVMQAREDRTQDLIALAVVIATVAVVWRMLL